MIDHAALTDGELADFYFSNLDFDPDAEAADTQAIVAEVTRRGLASEQLHVAWNALAAAQSNSKLPETVVARILEGDRPIAAVRAWRGIGMLDLAQASGVDATLIEEVEAGTAEASPDAVDAITAALNVAPADLANPQDGSDEIGEDDIPW